MSALVLACTAWCLVLAAAPAAFADQHGRGAVAPPGRVLWIGNSFTFFNGGIPAAVHSIAADRGFSESGDLDFAMLTEAGAHLKDHLGLIRDGQLAPGGNWDIIVLQGYSDEAVQAEKRPSFVAAAEALDAAIGRSGARTLLFMTWAYSGAPGMADAVAVAYKSLGERIGAPVVPVGLAFAAAQRRFPHVALYADHDIKHPSLAGTYLAACTFFAALYGQSAEGAAPPAGLPPADARELQRIGWTTAKSYFAW